MAKTNSAAFGSIQLKKYFSYKFCTEGVVSDTSPELRGSWMVIPLAKSSKIPGCVLSGR